MLEVPIPGQGISCINIPKKSSPNSTNIGHRPPISMDDPDLWGEVNLLQFFFFFSFPLKIPGVSLDILKLIINPILFIFHTFITHSLSESSMRIKRDLCLDFSIPIH